MGVLLQVPLRRTNANQKSILKARQMHRHYTEVYNPLQQVFSILESFSSSRHFLLHPDACKVKFSQCYTVQAGTNLLVCFSLHFSRMTLRFIATVQPSAADPLLHQHSGSTEADVWPAFSLTQRN